VKILLDNTTEVGLRAGHMLMGQDEVDYVGVWRSEGARRSARSGPATDFDGFDVALTDRPAPHGDLVARASVTGIPIVLWDEAADVPPGSAPVPIIRGANLARTFGAALAAHLSSGNGTAHVVVARTAPGDPLTTGTAVSFPAPVGPLYADVSVHGGLVAPFSGPWAAVSVSTDRGDHERAVGVVDHPERLEAFALAATVLAAARDAFEPGLCEASSQPEAVMEALKQLELDVAVWRSHQ